MMPQAASAAGGSARGLWGHLEHRGEHSALS